MNTFEKNEVIVSGVVKVARVGSKIKVGAAKLRVSSGLRAGLLPDPKGGGVGGGSTSGGSSGGGTGT